MTNQVDCELLIQIDQLVAQEFVPGEPPRSMVEMMPSDELRRMIEANKLLHKMYLTFEKIYKETDATGVKIKHDKFGGYGLFNESGSCLNCGVIDFPVGLLRVVPQELMARSDWMPVSVMEGLRNRSKVHALIGSIRFANHSCLNNCVFDMRFGFEKLPCVRLKVIKPIKSGEELLVSYGEDFFGNDNEDCLCGLHQEKEKTPDTSVAVAKKKKFARRVIRAPSLEQTPVNEYSCRLDSFVSKHLNSESDDIVDSEDENPSNDCVTHIESQFEENLDNSVVLQSDHNVPSESFDNQESEDEDSDFPAENFDLGFGFPAGLLNEKEDITMHNTLTSLLAIVSKHGGSDELLHDLVRRERAIFDETSSCYPSSFRLKREMKNQCAKLIKSREKQSSGDVIFLRFSYVLLKIVHENINAIRNYSAQSKKDEDVRLPPCEENQRLSIRLIVNSDGAQIIKSKTVSAWPLWAAVADLPPKLRSSFRNIVLCSLWFGQGKPDFNKIFEEFISEIDDEFDLTVQETTLKVKFVPVFLVADLIAKARILNMKQYNGFYGCCLCTMRGEHRLGAHVYPHDEDFEMRDANSYQADLKRALLHKKPSDRNESKTTCSHGVVGESKIFEVIENLPLNAPVDTMHQLLLGVAQEILSFLYNSLETVERDIIDLSIDGLRTTLEFPRKPRRLSQIVHFKASELKFYLLYLAPILFQPFVKTQEDKDDVKDLKRLVLSLRQIYESADQVKSIRADTLINKFCRNMADRYPNGKFESHNFHSLRHLAWQARNIGPLWVSSASMFESANHFLALPFTGTVNHCELLVSRYIRRLSLHSTVVKEDRIGQLTKSFLGETCQDLDDSYGLRESEVMQDFKINHPEFRLFSRLIYDWHLESEAYSRGSGANIFILFTRQDGDEGIGKISFFAENRQKFCYVQFIEIEKVIYLTEAPEFGAFGYVGTPTQSFALIKMNSVCKKLLRFDFDNKVFFIVIMKHFEHD